MGLESSRGAEQTPESAGKLLGRGLLSCKCSRVSPQSEFLTSSYIAIDAVDPDHTCVAGHQSHPPPLDGIYGGTGSRAPLDTKL